MAQADGVVANGTGSAVRSDINNQYAALWSNHSGSTEPSSGKVAYQFWADTNTSILKIRNSANNAWINLFTLAGGIDVDAASNFNEDVTFTGASYNLVWDKSDNALEFADNAKCTFGTGGDLEIFHDGSYSYIDNTHSGGLWIRGGTSNYQIGIQAKNSENSVLCTGNGAVSLYFDNSAHLTTTAAGGNLDGVWDINNGLKFYDTIKAQFGTGNDLEIYHNGTNSVIQNTTGILYLNAATSETAILMNPNGSVEINYDNSKKLETTASGAQVFGYFYPSADDTYALGLSNLRWDVVYAQNGTINTSDRNEKNTIVESDLGLNFVNKLKPVSYKWNRENSKTHYGLIAQDVEEILSTEGKTDKDFAALNIPTEGPMGLNYSEFISPLIKAVQELSTEVETLKTKVAALEAK